MHAWTVGPFTVEEEVIEGKDDNEIEFLGV
jgi:hypothetical protein